MDKYELESLNIVFGTWLTFAIRDNKIGVRDDYSRGAAMATASAMRVLDPCSNLFDAVFDESRR